jgi:hypothetical protein
MRGPLSSWSLEASATLPTDDARGLGTWGLISGCHRSEISINSMVCEIQITPPLPCCANATLRIISLHRNPDDYLLPTPAPMDVCARADHVLVTRYQPSLRGHCSIDRRARLSPF